MLDAHLLPADQALAAAWRELCPRCLQPRIGAFRYCRGCAWDYDVPALRAAIDQAVTAGYRLVERTPTTARLLRPTRVGPRPHSTVLRWIVDYVTASMVVSTLVVTTEGRVLGRESLLHRPWVRRVRGG